MKRKFYFLRVLITLALTVLLLGCGNKQQGPDVSAKALYNLAVLGDSTEIEMLGLSNEDAQEILEEEKAIMVTTITNEFTSAGVALTDEKIQEITNALLKALSRLSVTTEVISMEEESAVVKVSTNHIGFLDLIKEVADATASEVIALNLTDEKEAEDKLMEKLLENFIFGLNTTYPSKDTIDKEFEFKLEIEKSDGRTYKTWIPNDAESFGSDIGEMVMGVK